MNKCWYYYGNFFKVKFRKHNCYNCGEKLMIVKHRKVVDQKSEEAKYYANVPMVSAIMQSVSGEEMGIALAREGGCSFIFGSQSIESQAQMVRNVKKYIFQWQCYLLPERMPVSVSLLLMRLPPMSSNFPKSKLNEKFIMIMRLKSSE